MVDVALEVDDAGPLGQHALREAVVEGVADFLHVGVAGAEEHVVADADDLRQEGDHVGGFADGFAVGDLRLAFVEVLDGQAEQVAGGREGEARAGGIVAEVGDGQPRVEDAQRDVLLVELLQQFGGLEDEFEFGHRLVPREQEVLAGQAGVQLFDGFEHFNGVHGFPCILLW